MSTETTYRNYPLFDINDYVADAGPQLLTAIEMADGDVHALMEALGGLAPIVHTHEIDDIVDLQALLDGKAGKDHDHSLGGLSNVAADADSALDGSILYRQGNGWVVGNPASVLGAHQHSIGNIENLGTILDAKLTATNLPAALAGVSTKATPADADSLVLVDSAASNAQKRLTWASLKATLKSWTDSLYAAAGHGHSAATTSAPGFMSTGDKAKLNAIASGATANAADNWLRDRANHTGTQAISTIDGLDAALASGMPTSGSTSPQVNFNTITAPGWHPTLMLGTTANGWGDGFYGYVFVLAYIGSPINLTQVSFPYSAGGKFWYRHRYQGTWSTWQSLASLSEVVALLAGKANSSHAHSAADVTSGTLPIARGGTGQTTEAGMRGVYTGSSSSNTAFPIGETLLVEGGTNGTLDRTGAATIRFSPSTQVYTLLGSGTVIAGTWRSRGRLTEATLSGGGEAAISYWYLMERVA